MNTNYQTKIADSFVCLDRIFFVISKSHFCKAHAFRKKIFGICYWSTS